MDVSQLRNFRDFLLLYNQISETCFKKCTNTFLSREVTPDEDLCINNCAQKYIYANNRVMEVFMEVQPIMINKRMEEISTAQVALETKNQQAALEVKNEQTALEVQNQQVEQIPQ